MSKAFDITIGDWRIRKPEGQAPDRAEIFYKGEIQSDIISWKLNIECGQYMPVVTVERYTG